MSVLANAAALARMHHFARRCAIVLALAALTCAALCEQSDDPQLEQTPRIDDVREERVPPPRSM